MMTTIMDDDVQCMAKNILSWCSMIISYVFFKNCSVLLYIFLYFMCFYITGGKAKQSKRSLNEGAGRSLYALQIT